jgi:hypothetical protein
VVPDRTAPTDHAESERLLERQPAEPSCDEVIVGVRPEHAHLWVDGNGLDGPIAGRAEYVEMLGREMLTGLCLINLII